MKGIRLHRSNRPGPSSASKIASTLATMLLAAAGGSPADAQQAPAASTSPLTMEIAGARLGMPFDQVKMTLVPGYRCDTTRTESTFADKVKDEVAKRRGLSTSTFDRDGVYGMECRGPSGEELQILFAHGAQGPVVSGITLRIPTGRVDRTALLRQLEAKYGRPPMGTVTEGCWSVGREVCSIVNNGPTVRLSAGGSAVQIFADRGTAAKEADAKAVQAAADRLAPKRAGAAL